MGQAIVDPPDPQENSKPAPTNSADDLLSQLAGNEIDRLLAESEGQTPAKAALSPLPPYRPRNRSDLTMLRVPRRSTRFFPKPSSPRRSRSQNFRLPPFRRLMF
jgi:hypothetical protein